MKRVNYISFATIVTATLIISACGGGSGGGNGGSNSDVNQTITHNGIEYKSVKSPTTGKIWLDRNLGAARVCQSFDDVACYGDYYQWGRGADGHEDSNSPIIKQKANTIHVNDRRFIAISGNWATVDSSGQLRAIEWRKSDGTSICPKGFHVPTIKELKAEFFGMTNKYEAFNSFLKLPSAGSRTTSGDLSGLGVHIRIWSSSAYRNQYAHYIYFDSINYFNITKAVFSYGMSVRCIKE